MNEIILKEYNDYICGIYIGQTYEQQSKALAEAQRIEHARLQARQEVIIDVCF